MRIGILQANGIGPHRFINRGQAVDLVANGSHVLVPGRPDVIRELHRATLTPRQKHISRLAQSDPDRFLVPELWTVIGKLSSDPSNLRPPAEFVNLQLSYPGTDQRTNGKQLQAEIWRGATTF